MDLLPHPGSPEFLAAIDAAGDVAAIDALRARLDFSAAEFCRRADVNESSYSRAKRRRLTPRPGTIRHLRDTLRRLTLERAGGGSVVALRAPA